MDNNIKTKKINKLTNAQIYLKLKKLKGKHNNSKYYQDLISNFKK
jgi:hypothetical protein